LFDWKKNGYVPTVCKVCSECWRDSNLKTNPDNRCIYGGPFVYFNIEDDSRIDD